MQNYVHSEMVRLSASYGGLTGSSNALRSNGDLFLQPAIQHIEPSSQPSFQTVTAVTANQRSASAMQPIYDTTHLDANYSPILHRERNFSSKQAKTSKPVKISKFFKLSYEEINEYLHSSYPLSGPGVISLQDFDTSTAAADVNHLQALDQTSDPELVLVNSWITKLQAAINNADRDSDSDEDAFLYDDL
jgi:hypothetical protein